MYPEAIRPAITIDPAVRARYRRRNRLHTLVLAAGAVLLLSLTAWTLAGPQGVLWAAVGGSLSVMLAARFSSALVLQLYGAREVTPAAFPQAHSIVRLLAQRAGLPRMPRLYLVPSRMVNAFSTGTREDSAVCITEGLLARLTPREFVGVMAHELAHVAHGDIHVMAMADVVARMTGIMSVFGLVLMMISLPEALAGGASVPWAAVLLLIVAPTLGSAVQLALSRTREFEADLGAASLTGDPEGLASALMKLERIQGRMWEAALPQGARIPDPSVLRSHPQTGERVRRLRALRAAPEHWLDTAAMPHVAGRSPVPDAGAPRRRLSRFGTWY
ncbi:zinc metalloprotease HtpX [Stappia indica]|uniref:M48 family metalloprotease n=1 Tax=Stappia indica TaxID=538381 RepID=A0A857C9Y4_9HYPH|nr:zinc metalloprotease HtpX [Stappia indica]QGZ35685.1 M48 family metalloprotease [Stappia indica]